MKMINFTVPDDLFLMSSGEDANYILYRPSKSVATLIDQDTAGRIALLLKKSAKNKIYDSHRENRLISKLESTGFIESHVFKEQNSNLLNSNNNPNGGSFSPHEVTLDITRKCNMECIYCYASGGTSSLSMSDSCAYSAIDLCVSNAFEKSMEFALHFHGGGEPSQEFNFLKKVFYYARVKCQKMRVKFKASVITNGVISSNIAKFYSENFYEITVSFDGDEISQNLQRPSKGGGKSFRKTFTTAKYIYERGIFFNIRTTITSLNVNRILEITKFFLKEFKGCIINYEPVALLGRASASNRLKCDPEIFAKNIYLAMKFTSEAGGRLLYSGISAHSDRKEFCAATSPSFCVGADGSVTSCFSYSNKDIIRELFIYGRYDEKSKKFHIDKRKIINLRKLSLKSDKYCEDCFCRTHCYGDCPAIRNYKIDRKLQFREIRSKNIDANRRCSMNRKIMLLILNDIVRGRTRPEHFCVNEIL